MLSSSGLGYLNWRPAELLHKLCSLVETAKQIVRRFRNQTLPLCPKPVLLSWTGKTASASTSGTAQRKGATSFQYCEMTHFVWCHRFERVRARVLKDEGARVVFIEFAAMSSAVAATSKTASEDVQKKVGDNLASCGGRWVNLIHLMGGNNNNSIIYQFSTTRELSISLLRHRLYIIV